MINATIIIKAPDQTVPDDVLNKALEAHGSCFGAAAIQLTENGDLQLMELSTLDKEQMTLENINNLQKETADVDLVLYFSSSSTGVAKEDVQPYVMIGDPGSPVLVAFLEGSFPGYPEKDGHVSEYYLANQYLRPKFHKIYDLVGKDVDKLMVELQDEMVYKDVMNCCGERGVITLLANNGVLITYDKADNAQKTAWGWASKTFSEFPKKEEAAAAPARSMSAFAKMKAAAGAAVSTITGPKLDGKGPVIGEATNVGEGTKAKVMATPLPTTTETVMAPSGYDGWNNSRKKQWCQNTLGYLPNPYKKEKSFLKQKPAGLADLNKQMQAAAAASEEPEIKTEPKPKDIEPKEVKPDVTLPAEVKTGVGLPIMSPDKRSAVKSQLSSGMFKKVLDRNAALITDPAKYNELESKIPDFFMQIGGVTKDEVENWPYEAFVEMGRAHPEALAVLVKNLLFDRKVQNSLRPKTVETTKVGETTIIRASEAPPLSGFALKKAELLAKRAAKAA